MIGGFGPKLKGPAATQIPTLPATAKNKLIHSRTLVRGTDERIPSRFVIGTRSLESLDKLTLP
jgi:hypothetical protein